MSIISPDDTDSLHAVSTTVYDDQIDDPVEMTGDTILVDRRGYAPEIAEQLGQDYLSDSILIFDSEQLESHVLSPEFDGSYGLLKSVDEEILQRSAPDGADYPFRLDLTRELDLREGYDRLDPAFRISAVWPEDQFTEEYKANELKEEINSLDMDQLSDRDQVESLVSASRHAELDRSDIPSLILNRTGTRDRFRYRDSGTTGYVMNPEQPLLFTINGDTTPFEAYDAGDWATLDLSEGLEELLGRRLLTDNNTLHAQRRELSYVFIEQFQQDIDSEYPGREHAVTRLEEYRDIEDYLPEELLALEELAEDGTLRSDTELLREQLRHMYGIDAFYETLLADIQDALDADTPVAARRLHGLDHCIGDIQQAYWDWSGSEHIAERAAKDLEYNAEAVTRFCRNTSLERHDGLFVSALINELEADHVELPDMTDVQYLGWKNDGTRITINGDTGRYLAKEMTDGRIDIHGTARSRIGIEMTGGEVYLHDSSSRTYNSCKGDVYVKKGGIVRDEHWKQIS